MCAPPLATPTPCRRFHCASSVLPQPRPGIFVGNSLRLEFQAFDAADDPPDDGEQPEENTNDDDRGQHAEKSVEQPDPEGANLKAVMALQPFRRIATIHIGHD